MNDLTSINGKAMLDRKVFIKLLASLEPDKLDETSTLYHIGYERAKADILQILGRSLGPEYSKSMSARLIQELRNDGSS